MPDVVKHAWTHRPRSQGGTDPIEIPPASSAAVFRASRTSNFTVVDGEYYGLAQTEGADPSATGIMSGFEFFNDSGDGSGVFDQPSVGTGEVLKLMAPPGGGDQDYLLAYDAGVAFTSSIDTTTVTVTLYLGRGVGGGTYSWETEVLEAAMASNVSGVAHPTLRLTGSIPVLGQWVDGVAGTDLSSLPTVSPILLVEGGTPTVDRLWCYYGAVPLTP